MNIRAANHPAQGTCITRSNTRAARDPPAAKLQSCGFATGPAKTAGPHLITRQGLTSRECPANVHKLRILPRIDKVLSETARQRSAS